MKRKGISVYIFATIALCLGANLSMLAFRTIYGINDGSYGYNLLLFAEWCFVIPYYSTIFIAQIVFGKECPNPRIKDKVTIGLTRMHMYFGQLIAELIVAAAFFAIAFVFFIGITYMFMFADHSIELWAVLDFLQKAIISLPLWIAGIAISHMLLYVCKKKRYAFLLFFLVVGLMPRIVMFFAAAPFEIGAFKWVRDYLLLTPRFNELPYFYTLNIAQILIASSIYTAFACVIGAVVYNKREY